MSFCFVSRYIYIYEVRRPPPLTPNPPPHKKLGTPTYSLSSPYRTPGELASLCVLCVDRYGVPRRRGPRTPIIPCPHPLTHHPHHSPLPHCYQRPVHYLPSASASPSSFPPCPLLQ